MPDDQLEYRLWVTHALQACTVSQGETESLSAMRFVHAALRSTSVPVHDEEEEDLIMERRMA